MKILIVGLGVQGQKRKKILNKHKIITFDKYNKLADFKNIKDIPSDNYDCVFLCVPDDQKFQLMKFFINKKKHILVEKPLYFKNLKDFYLIQRNAIKNNVLCYVAYNHQFEPHFIKIKKLLSSKSIGKIYSCRIFYGNGTAKLVKKSNWRDKGSGVLQDLAPHLLDILSTWFKNKKFKFKVVSSNKFENNSLDHVVILSQSNKIRVELEMTMCMWKNHLTCDIIGSKGSAHIDSLCKWGPSSLIVRKRKFPAGIPSETNKTLRMSDPTWKLEHRHFFNLIKKKKKTDLRHDVWIYKELKKMEKQI